jgi:hypothetical protein
MNDDIKWFLCWYPDLGETEQDGYPFTPDEAETPEIAAARYAVTQIREQHRQGEDLLVRVGWKTKNGRSGFVDVAILVKPAQVPANAEWHIAAIVIRSIRAKMLEAPRPSWLHEPQYQWFMDGCAYAATQTHAIPALAKTHPEELYHAVALIMSGARRAGHELP